MVLEIPSATERVFCHFGLFFAFYHPNNPKNQNFEKNENKPRDTIVLNMCIINDSHIMHGF